MAKESQIRWKKGDYISLGKAVSNFNKKIKELQKEEEKTYLPEEVNYKDIRENITTRKELNRFIKSLRDFKKEGAENLYKTEAGEEITTWEYQQLKAQKTIAKRRLTKELKELNKPTENGFSRVQMGSIRAREIEAQLKNLEQIESKKGYEFKRLKERLQSIGTLDYTMRKAIIYRENYINEMKKYSHLDNYDLLVKKMNSIKNPIDFYENISDNDLLADLTYQSDEYYTQEEFNRFVEDWGIQIDDKFESVSKEGE